MLVVCKNYLGHAKNVWSFGYIFSRVTCWQTLINYLIFDVVTVKSHYTHFNPKVSMSKFSTFIACAIVLAMLFVEVGDETDQSDGQMCCNCLHFDGIMHILDPPYIAHVCTSRLSHFFFNWLSLLFEVMYC